MHPSFSYPKLSFSFTKPENSNSRFPILKNIFRSLPVPGRFKKEAPSIPSTINIPPQPAQPIELKPISRVGKRIVLKDEAVTAAGHRVRSYASTSTSSSAVRQTSSNHSHSKGLNSTSSSSTAGVVAGLGVVATPTISAVCCDKCDGKHATESCPYFKKVRDNHPDARRRKSKMGGVSSLPGEFYTTVSVVRQPGDGSCLFHSLCFGLRDGTTASVLRAQISSFVIRNPDFEISETPLSDWVRWDSNTSHEAYARSIAASGWGGGIEMAVVSHLKSVNIHVYERQYGVAGYKRISAFDHQVSPAKKKTIRVLYGGRNHYGSLYISHILTHFLILLTLIVDSIE